MNVSKITKEQILQSATQLAREHGLQNLNIRSVASRCNVSIGSIYNYYPDKCDLLIHVIEDFWKQACTLEDMRKLKLTTFLENYQQMYTILYDYFHRFEHEWMFQLQNLDEKTKELAKGIEESYYQDIRHMLIKMIEHDTSLPVGLWNAEFTKAAFADFVFTNTLLLIQQNQQQPTFFLSLLAKLLH